MPNDPGSLSANADKKKTEEKSIENKQLAIASFTMAFTTAELMEYVEDAKTNKYPEGIATEVVKSLMKKYRPTDRIAGVEAEKELMKLRMKSNDDPDKYFGKLAVLKSKYKENTSTFDEDKMIANTLTRAPKRYSGVLTSVMQQQGTNLKLEHLQESMRRHWRIRNNIVTSSGANNYDSSDDEEGEAVLSVASSIKCYNFDKFGHKANKCPDKK